MSIAPFDFSDVFQKRVAFGLLEYLFQQTLPQLILWDFYPKLGCHKIQKMLEVITTQLN